MTDVLGLSLCLWSVFFFLVYRTEQRISYLTTCSALGIAATLVRQDSIVLLLGLALANAFSSVESGLFQKRLRSAVLAAIPLASAWISLKIYDYGFPLINEGGMPSYYSGFGSVIATIQANGIASALKCMIAQMIQALFYGGLFVAPFACALKVAEARVRRLYVFSFAASLLLAAALSINGQAMPMTGNIFHRAGVGPMLFLDLEAGHHDHLPELWPGIYFLATYLTSCGVVCLMLAGCNALETFLRPHSDSDSKDDRFDYSLGLFVGLLWIALAGIKMSNFDRHFLMLLLPGCILLTRFCKDVARVRFATVMLCFAIYSVLGTHDYLAANRAKAEAYSYLRHQMQIEPEQIDAGIELNGFYLWSGKLPADNSKVKFWFAKGDRFLLTLGPMTGYKSVKSFEFSRWLAFERCHVEILEKVP